MQPWISSSSSHSRWKSMKANRTHVAHHGTCALGRLSPMKSAGAATHNTVSTLTNQPHNSPPCGRTRNTHYTPREIISCGFVVQHSTRFAGCMRRNHTRSKVSDKNFVSWNAGNVWRVKCAVFNHVGQGSEISCSFSNFILFTSSARLRER